MSYFKLTNKDFSNFISISKTEIEKQFGEDFEFQNLNSSNIYPGLIKKIIRNLEKLTLEDKILWSNDSTGILRGIVTESCLLANYKIIIERWIWEYCKGYKFPILDDTGTNCKISLIKGLLSSNKVEHTTDLEKDASDLLSLLKTIDIKRTQESN